MNTSTKTNRQELAYDALQRTRPAIAELYELGTVTGSVDAGEIVAVFTSQYGAPVLTLCIGPNVNGTRAVNVKG